MRKQIEYAIWTVLVSGLLITGSLLTNQTIGQSKVDSSDGRKYKGFEYELGSPYETEKTASYIIGKVGSDFYMLNGTTAHMDWHDTNGSAVITAAMGNLTSGSVFVKSGDYGGSSVTVPSGVMLILQIGVTGVSYTLDSGGFMIDQNGDFEPSTLNNGAYWGELINGTAGETLEQGEVVFLDSDGKYYLADCNATTTMYAVALALEDLGADSEGNFLIEGYYCNTSWSFTVGSETRIYVSWTAGQVTETQPDTTGDQVQVIGYAVTSDTVYFDFDSTVVEIA